MNSNLEDLLVKTQQEYVRVRLKAEKSMDHNAKMKIKQAEKLLKNAEDEAYKTMDPKLKKKSDELFRKLQTIQNKLEHE